MFLSLLMATYNGNCLLHFLIIAAVTFCAIVAVNSICLLSSCSSIVSKSGSFNNCSRSSSSSCSMCNSSCRCSSCVCSGSCRRSITVVLLIVALVAIIVVLLQRTLSNICHNNVLSAVFSKSLQHIAVYSVSFFSILQQNLCMIDAVSHLFIAYIWYTVVLNVFALFFELFSLSIYIMCCRA